MAIGRTHKWYYDRGEWKETKITPDKWEIHYEVTKRRAGKAPEGSGVPVGTEYHWCIIADQHVKKMNANDYSTEMIGVKYKVAHKRADKDKWNISEKTQHAHLIKILEEVIAELKKDADANLVGMPPHLPEPQSDKQVKAKRVKRKKSNRNNAASA